MSDLEIEFGEPPADLGQRGNEPLLVPIMSALQERPGEWARVRVGIKVNTASATVNRLRQKGCEANQRGNGAGGADVWARWPK